MLASIAVAGRRQQAVDFMNFFSNISGLSGQTVRNLKNDLLKLEKLNPDAVEYMRHDVVNDKVIKLYKKHPELLVDKDALFEMNLLCQKWMERQGYEQNGSFSENSQFFPYRYDWVMGKPYLGLGSGAVSHFGGVRFVKLGNLSLYFSSLERNIMPIWNFRVFSNLEQAYRTLLLRLQTKAGITTKELKDRFGAGNYNAINLTINKLKDYELIIDNGGVVRLTDSYGRYFVEDICDLIMDESRRILGIRI